MGCSDGKLRLVSVDCEQDTYTTIEEIDGKNADGEDDSILHHEINNCANKAICGT